jgi:signal transduction histidine kinase/CheY-like chemotaxis protein
MRRTSQSLLFARHGVVAVSFLTLLLFLNRPEVILVNRLGYVVWFPAAGLALSFMLGLSPWYAPLVCLSGALAGKLFYNQPLASYGQTIGAISGAAFYCAAAYILRATLRIESGLRRRRDVVFYVSVTTLACFGSTAVGVACLAGDHTIRWSEYCQSASIWFLGDEIGLLGVAPFLLIHVLPWIRTQLTRDSGTIWLTPASAPERSDAFAILESLSQILAIVVLLWVMFGSTLARFQLFFLSFVPIIWIAMRQGIRRVVAGLLGMNFGIVLALHFFPTTTDQLSKIGLLMFVVSALGLLIGSVVTERHRIAIELLDRTSQLQDANAQLLASKEKAEEASRAKSEFLANMSHEIRTPINGIVGMAELVMGTRISAEQRDYLETMKTSANSLLRVINDILDFSKIESGKLELSPVEFELQGTVTDAVRAFSLSAQEKDLELDLSFAPELPKVVVLDPGRLGQILINLVGNAIKFTHRGKIVVRVDLETRSSESPQLHFSVNDTGIGIPAEKHAMIFEAFSQADGSTTRNYGGTGLGLSISSRLVKLLGGSIWLESTPNRGSTFHFTVQFQSAQRVSEESNPVRLDFVSVPAFIADNKTSRLRILVAEDNLVNQTVIRHMLKNRGHLPTIVNNGREAVAALEAQAFDLVFMDVQMPEMDGLTATRTIRENERRTNLHIPIVAMTAHAMKGDKETCLAAGMDDYISKPATGEQVEQLISRIFSVRGQIPNQSACSAAPAASWDSMEALQRVDGDAELLNELIQIFLAESPTQVEKLNRAIESGDVDAMQRATHTLKGELKYLGLTQAAEQAHALENMCRAGELQGVAELFRAFKSEMTAISTSMQRVMPSRQAASHF